MPALESFWVETRKPDFRTIALWNFDEAAKLFRPDHERALLTAYNRDRSWIITVVNPTDKEFEVTLSTDESLLSGTGGSAEFEWGDAQKDILPPKTDVASGDEIKGLLTALFDSVSDLGLDENVELGKQNAMNLLDEPISPEEKERRKLAPKVANSAVTPPVQAKDYRLIKMEVK